MVYRKKRYTKNSSTLSKKVKDAMKEAAFSTQETKHHRVEDLISFSSSGTLVELNTVDSQGVTSGSFIGQEIRQMGIRIRGKLSQADSSNVVRLTIFTPSTAFEARLESGVALPNDLYYLPTNWSAIREAHVKKTYLDTNMVLNQSDASNDKIKLLKLWVDLKMKKFKYLEGITPATGSDKVYMLIMSDSALIPHPRLEYSSTLYYKDA